jgi:hypothetical protein
MLKFSWMEDPVKGVFSLKFIGSYHINAYVRFIATESSPDFSSTLTEGDSGTPILSQQELGPAKQAVYHLNWDSISIGALIALPKRTFRRNKVIPQGRDEAVFVACPILPAILEGFFGPWHR